LILGDVHTKRDKKQGLWAREVFHSVLATDLKMRGAATVDQLYHRLSWFMLPFDLIEVLQILESARRNGLVKLLGDDLDVLGKCVSEEWALTEEGAKLKRPRALALPDLSWGVIHSTPGISTVFTSAKDLLLGLVPFLALFGASLDVLEEQRLIIAAASGVVLGVVLWNGIRGDRKLQAAARSWPRMQEKRQARYEYQLNPGRLGFLPAMLALLYLAIALGGTLAFSFWKIAVGAGAVLVLFGVIYIFTLRKLRKDWSNPRLDLCAWELKWHLRGGATQPASPAPKKAI
jgi:hypothetical protein